MVERMSKTGLELLQEMRKTLYKKLNARINFQVSCSVSFIREVLKTAWETFAREEVAGVISGQSQNFVFSLILYILNSNNKGDTLF